MHILRLMTHEPCDIGAHRAPVLLVPSLDDGDQLCTWQGNSGSGARGIEWGVVVCRVDYKFILY